VKSKSDASHKATTWLRKLPLRDAERENWDFFLGLPEVDRSKLSHTQVKDIQLLRPLFEFSGAARVAARRVHQAADATVRRSFGILRMRPACSSIYGGNLPTTPYTSNSEGRGPTWANRPVEDNAEFGFGMRVALDQQKIFAETLLTRLAAEVGVELVADILGASQKTENGDRRTAENGCWRCVRSWARMRLPMRRTCWRLPIRWCGRACGFWAAMDGRYDIGFGGLDHVLGWRKKRERAGAGHGGLLEYRWTDVEGDTARRGGPSLRPAARRTARRTWRWRP